MSCPICRSLLSRSVQHPECKLSVCDVCSHVFEDPPVVTAKYDRDYILQRYAKYPTTDSMSYLRLGLLKGYVTYGRLLDVGYGNGSFVRIASAGGYDAYGNDVHGADFGVREASLNDKSEWDVVTFFDSLEHFPDLDVVRDLSKRSLFVVVSLPNRPERFPDNTDWKHYRPGEHLHYFSVRSLSRLFDDKKLLVVTDLEDTIRTSNSGEKNILTVILARKS